MSLETGTGRTAAEGGGLAPVPPWPGQFIRLGAGMGEVHVRSAPAEGAAGGGRAAGAEPALCVHGFGGSSTDWTDLMDLLRAPAAAARSARAARDLAPWQDAQDTAAQQAGPYETVPVLACDAVDLPGFGYSPPPPDGRYTVSAQAAAVARLIERRGRGPVHLIGNSLGGAVCTRVAAARPELVRTLTLISPAMPDLWPRLAVIRFPPLCVPWLGRWLLRRAQSVPAETRVALTLASIYFDRSLVHPERFAQEVAELKRRDTLGYDIAVLLASGRSIVAEYLRRGTGSLWRDASRVTAPSLVIYGSHDKLVDPRMAGRAARAFRDCRVVVLPRTGHVAQMEHPAVVAAEMRRMLAGLPGPAEGADGYPHPGHAGRVLGALSRYRPASTGAAHRGADSGTRLDPGDEIFPHPTAGEWPPSSGTHPGQLGRDGLVYLNLLLLMTGLAGRKPRPSGRG
jgi:pimeloyl-ACP methyl ester carboxylesterase